MSPLLNDVLLKHIFTRQALTWLLDKYWENAEGHLYGLLQTLIANLTWFGGFPRDAVDQVSEHVQGLLDDCFHCRRRRNRDNGHNWQRLRQVGPGKKKKIYTDCCLDRSAWEECSPSPSKDDILGWVLPPGCRGCRSGFAIAARSLASLAMGAAACWTKPCTPVCETAEEGTRKVSAQISNEGYDTNVCRVLKNQHKPLEEACGSDPQLLWDWKCSAQLAKSPRTQAALSRWWTPTGGTRTAATSLVPE